MVSREAVREAELVALFAARLKAIVSAGRWSAKPFDWGPARREVRLILASLERIREAAEKQTAEASATAPKI